MMGDIKMKKEIENKSGANEKISLIVPCYNEQESLPIFYEEVCKISKKLNEVDFEFLFVNDGSKDKTLEILRDLSKKDKRVRYISFSRNFGKEAGMFAGLENSTGDYVAIMDADMQDPPEMIIEMYYSIKNEGYDCVALYSPKHKGYSPLRKFFTNCWYKLIGKISSVEQVPGARDFRLMKRVMVDAIINMGEYNRYSKGIFSFVGFDTKWIDYEAPDRVAGESKFNFIKLFKYAMEGILAFSTTPLVLSALVGIIFCIIAFIAIIFIIIKTLAFGDPIGGWPSLACMILFLSGVQLFFLGIIGMYLSKTYLEVKKRPIYIIKETEETKR
jgi:glycosyltransferase involved in cell wall biosynthesis